METKRCLEPGCKMEVEYTCQCTSPETLLCKQHFTKHSKILYKNHKFEPAYSLPLQGTKEAILKFLSNEKSKQNKLKRDIAANFSQRLLDSERDVKRLFKNFDSYSADISNTYVKISRTKKLWKQEQDPLLELLRLQPGEAVDKVKMLFPGNIDWYNNAEIFWGLSEKIEKIIQYFIKDKFEAYLDKRLNSIENAFDEHKETCKSTREEHNLIFTSINSELENVKDSIDKLIGENKKSEKELVDWRESAGLKLENDTNLINSQIGVITDDLNKKLIKAKIQCENSENIMLTTKELKEKTLAILNRPIDIEIEQDFRATCSIYENDVSIYDPPLQQAYQDYLDAFHRKTSLYSIYTTERYKKHQKILKTHLFIYDTENERHEVKVLETPQAIENCDCIVQLPNANLFCWCYSSSSNHSSSSSRISISFVIDTKNYAVQTLPCNMTPQKPLPSVYFNHIIYSVDSSRVLQYDLAQYKFTNFVEIPPSYGFYDIILFNESIIIAQEQKENLVRYSINRKNCTTIPYRFPSYKRKILLGADRIYLIVCDNESIYESSMSNDTDWTRIGASTISNSFDQIYRSYNKGTINICLTSNGTSRCYKFDLNKKSLTGVF